MGRPVILRAGALLALLAGWILAPSTASATCGDYVTSRTQREAHALMTEHGMATHDTGHGHTMSPTQARRDRLPCSGPTCSNRQSVPDAPIPPVSAVRAELWCDTTWPAPSLAPEPVSDLFDRPLLWPSQHATTLARPPRAFCGA